VMKTKQQLKISYVFNGFTLEIAKNKIIYQCVSFQNLMKM